MKNIFSVEFFVKKNGSYGSVTIFLTMIILPMLFLMITLTDYAKIMVAKRQVSGAGDMALSAGLSYYDEYLKDMYGLFAVSKDIEDLQYGLEEYFTNTLLGEGLDVDSPFLQEIKNIFAGSDGEEDAYLKLINLQKRAFIISEIEGANFANATLLNNQIMDYMEFRGPILLATGIIDKIGAFKELNKEKDAVKEKVKFEKKLQKAEKKCITACEKINEYNEALDTLKIEDMQNLIKEANEAYKEAVRYIFLIQENPNAEPKEMTSDKISVNISIDKICGDLEKMLNSGYAEKVNKLLEMSLGDNAYKKAEYLYAYNEVINIYNEKNIQGYGEKLIELIKEERKKYNNSENEAKGYEKKIIMIVNGKDKLNIEALDTATKYYESLRKFVDTGDNNSYQKLYEKGGADKVLNYINDEIIEEAKKYYGKELYEIEIKDHIDELTKVIKLWIKNENSMQNINLSEYEKIYEEYYRYKEYFSKEGTCYKNAYSIWKNRGRFVTDAINDGDITIQELENMVKSVIEKLEKAIIAVEDIINTFQDLENTRDKAWQVKIDVLSGESKTSMQSDLSEEAGDIDSKSAIECLSELEIAKKKLNKFLDKVKDITFNKSIYDIVKEYNKKGVTNLDQRNKYAEDYFDEPENHLKIDDSFIKEAGALPKKITEKNNEFYRYLVKVVAKKAKVDDSEESDAIELKNNLLNNNSNPDSNASGLSDESGSSEDKNSDTASSNSLINESLEALYTDPTLPSKATKNTTSTPKSTELQEDDDSINEDSLDGDSNIMSWLSMGIEIINNCVEDIYLTEYIMNMFTYRTYNRNEDGTAIKDELVSLSGYSYNTKSPLYAAEAEYILWGMDTAKMNLDATYAAIFGIRFLMNAIYALTNSEINTQTRAIATAIVGFTGFGVPIMKTVLDLGLALLETIMDMRMLIQGKPVAIYKNKDTWVCSLNGIKNAIVTEVKIAAAQKATELTNAAIDKLQTCAVDKLDEVADELTENLTRQASVAVDTIVSTIMKRVEEKLSAVSIGNCVSDDEIKESIDNWVNDFKNSLGVPDSVPDKENVTDYVLYIAYQKIKTEEFKNKIANKIIELQNKTTESANIKISEYTTEVSKYVETILGIEKEKDSDGNETYTKIFGVDYNDVISSAIKNVKDDIKSLAVKKTEEARKAINERISKYSENLISSKSNTSVNTSATGNTVTKSSSAAMTMDYKEYLTMFLILSGLSSDEQEKHLLRTSDLIQINVGQAKKDDEFDSKFAMAKCKTHLKVEATVSGNTFFTGTAYLKNTENNIYLKDSNGIYGIKYIGIDGY